MKIRMETDSGASRILIAPSGDLDITARRTMLHAVSVADRGGFLATVFDLRAVPFMDCAGLGPIVAANEAARDRGGAVTLLRPRPAVTLLLRLTGFDSLIAPLRAAV